MGVHPVRSNGVTPIMALSDASVRAAKAGDAQYKLYDEGGLFLIVKPSGGKLWRLKYRHQGKEQQLSIGVFPDVSLKDARLLEDIRRFSAQEGVHGRAHERYNELLERRGYPVREMEGRVVRPP